VTRKPVKTNPSRRLEDEADRTESDDLIQDDAIIGRALRLSLGLAAAVGCLVLFIAGLAWLNRPVPEDKKTELVLPEKRELAPVQKPQIPLVDITASSGVTWQHFNAMDGEKLLPETMGGGVAVFDYDRDGDQDILFVGGQAWPWARSPIPSPASLCLYANDGQAKFTDVTAAAGLAGNYQAMGPAIGDFNADGWPDLLVTGVGGNHLFENQAGQFRDVTEQSGIAGSPQDWTTSAVWFDYDNDSRLDLFVCNYVQWNRQLDLSIGFSLTGIGRAYGQPTHFTGTYSYLFHNEGAGKFRDVSEAAGIRINNPNTPVPEGKALGVSLVDFNRDGWLDLIVANDTVRNYLFVNKRNGTFEESGIPAGIAFDRNGEATGAMGIDVGCFRNGHETGVIIGNFAGEPCSLYVSQGPQMPFLDEAIPSGLGPVTRLSLTFGTFFCDLDLDGRLDVLCANGHLESEIAKVLPNQHYQQPPLLFWNAGVQGSTELVRLDNQQVGHQALQPMVGRGAAYGDLDRDGDLDLILVANGGLPRILRNDQNLGHHWLRLRLVGQPENRDCIGAVVRLADSSGTQTRCVTATRSYLSQCELPITFGLGKRSEPVEVEIWWPNGQKQRIPNLTVDQEHILQEPGDSGAPDAGQP